MDCRIHKKYNHCKNCILVHKENKKYDNRLSLTQKKELDDMLIDFAVKYSQRVSEFSEKNISQRVIPE